MTLSQGVVAYRLQEICIETLFGIKRNLKRVQLEQIDANCCSIIIIMGQFRSAPCTEKKSQTGSTQRLSFAVTGMCGWRIYMEDAHIAQPDIGNGCSLFAVFDGHGGSEVAKYVARHFVPTLVANQHFQNKNYEKSLIDTYSTIDRMLRAPEGEKQLKKIKREAVDKPNTECDEEESYAGCTAVVCLLTENYIYVANAGDSRCMVSVEGKCEPLSFDHKPDEEIELNRIKSAGGDVIQGRVNGNINLSRALGDFEYKANPDKAQDQQLIISKPDIMRRSLEQVDYIILGCDGIFQKKKNQQIVEMVNLKVKQKSLQETCQQIVQSLLAPSTQYQHGLDNMTMILVEMNHS